MEGVEWLQIDERWIPQYLDQSQQAIKKASKSDLDAVRLHVFENFLNKL